MSTVGNTAKIKKCLPWDFPGVPVVKNPPFNAEDTGSIPGRGTKTPHTVGRLNPCTTTGEAHIPQLEKRKSPCTSMKTQCIKKKKKKASLHKADSLESETDTKEN